jgi:hypothetical protein
MTYEDINSLSVEKRRNDEHLWALWQQVACWLWKQRKPQVDTLFCRNVGEPILRDLFRQYLYYSIEDGGEIETPKVGIARSCSLSPLVGASLLYHYDSDFG